MNDVIRYKTPDNVVRKTPSIVWRVLIVDNLGMRMISACTKMHNISDEGITSKYYCVLYLLAILSLNVFALYPQLLKI